MTPEEFGRRTNDQRVGLPLVVPRVTAGLTGSQWLALLQLFGWRKMILQGRKVRHVESRLNSIVWRISPNLRPDLKWPRGATLRRAHRELPLETRHS